MIRARIRDIELSFETGSNLFSPRKIDAGTLVMLSCAHFNAADKVLDLGCGYGPVGIVAAKLIDPARVYLIDSDPAAVEVASRNARINRVEGVTVALSDGFRSFDEAGFTQILCNPPYHSDFAVPKHFIHRGFNRLVVGGTLWMVTQRQVWYRNKLRAIFGGVQEHVFEPYVVFEAIKRSSRYASAGEVAIRGE